MNICRLLHASSLCLFPLLLRVRKNTVVNVDSVHVLMYCVQYDGAVQFSSYTVHDSKHFFSLSRTLAGLRPSAALPPTESECDTRVYCPDRFALFYFIFYFISFMRAGGRL